VGEHAAQEQRGALARARELARELVRAAGAALVDHDDVATSANRGEALRVSGRLCRRGLTWTTGEMEQRVGRALIPERRQHNDVERNATPASTLAILVHPMRRTARKLGEPRDAACRGAQLVRVVIRVYEPCPNRPGRGRAIGKRPGE